MAATTPIVEGHSFEEVVHMHAERFAAYLRGMLGLQAEGRGGRVAVDDTLQDALLAIYSEWPELRDVRDDERDRRMYRCLRDAAGRALRSELGRRGGSEASRPQLVSLDRLMVALDDDAPARDRELTASLLGTMVQEIATGEATHDARMTLDRGILVAGLRALTEREAVILIAVDYLEWGQPQLAERLGLGYSLLRQDLFTARKIFYTLVRHAAGVEVEDEERARLVAYLSGELRGADKREVSRHLRHCKACQDLHREMNAFGGRAVAVLTPLPFLFGAKVLVRKSSVKAATVGSGAKLGVLTQPGAAKAVAGVVALLAVGFGGLGVLAQLDHDQHHPRVGPAPPAVTSGGVGVQPPPPGMRRLAAPSSAPASAGTGSSSASKTKTKTKTTRSAKSPSRSSSSASTRQPATTTQTTTRQTTPPPPSSTKPKSNGGKNNEFIGP